MNHKNNKNKELSNFYLFMTGQFVSQFGSKMTSYGLVLWSYGQTGSVLSTSLLTICTMLPSMLLSFLSGSLSDSWNKKNIMLIADSIAAIFSFIVLVMLFSDTLEIHYLYFINIILGIMDSFQNPASEVAVSLMVTKENYIRTSGIRTLSKSVISVFTPLITASVYAFIGLRAIVIIDLCTFLFAFTTLLCFVKIKEIPSLQGIQKESVWQKCRSGVAYLYGQKGILVLILFMAFVNLQYGIYSANLAPMVLSRNGNNEIQLGIVTGAVGAAGIAGTALVPIAKKQKQRTRVILNILTFSFLVCDPFLAIGKHYYLWTLAVFGGNVLIPLMNAHIEYIMRTMIPIQMQGRVFAARNTLQYTTTPLGYLIGGIMADYLFEPFMAQAGSRLPLLTALVGEGHGSGIALVYLVTAAASAAGCCLFRRNRDLKQLDTTVV